MNALATVPSLPELTAASQIQPPAPEEFRYSKSDRFVAFSCLATLSPDYSLSPAGGRR
jgi:hypothetical protein